VFQFKHGRKDNKKVEFMKGKLITEIKETVSKLNELVIRVEKEYDLQVHVGKSNKSQSGDYYPIDLEIKKTTYY
jgi:hypothetical protein